MLTTQPARPRAVLVGVQLPTVLDAEHAADLAELARLVKTLGYDAVATVSQKRSALAAGTVLGSGKLKDLARLTGGSGVIASGATLASRLARTGRAAALYQQAIDKSRVALHALATLRAVASVGRLRRAAGGLHAGRTP